MYVNGAKDLLSHLRLKYYTSKRNKTMNFIVGGPWGHGKTRLLESLFGIKREGFPRSTNGTYTMM